MELLVLKTGKKYLRLSNDRYELTGMNKASVYPVSEFNFVQGQLEKFKAELNELSIKKLTITESDIE